MKTNQLLKIGFKDTSWTDDGEHFTEHTFEGSGFKICVSGTGFIELCVEGNYVTLYNIKTVEQIEQLIKLLS